MSTGLEVTADLAIQALYMCSRIVSAKQGLHRFQCNKRPLPLDSEEDMIALEVLQLSVFGR